MPEFRAVKFLSDETARKIAAGEVIDRPASIVRELLDNSIDAASKSILVELDSGGIEKIRVVDNGIGMTEGDLRLCAEPHATSKISTADDLLCLSTLGFRGEALSSIAAVADLQITSCREGVARRMETSFGGEICVFPATLAGGTIVQVKSLFKNFPARKEFLRRAASESALCRQVFVEKAAAHPEIAFKLFCDGELRLSLDATRSLAERLCDALQIAGKRNFFGEERAEGDGFSADLVLSEPSVFRADRKQIFVFANGRRISEFALVQAMEYGAKGHFPNGTFPIGTVFLHVNPAAVDFNIHPAKKEARFKDLPSIHRAVSEAVRRFYSKSEGFSAPQKSPFSAASFASDSAAHRYSAKKNPLEFAEKSGGQSFSDFLGRTNARSEMFFAQMDAQNAAFECQNAPDGKDFLYLGQALGVFLVAQKADSLFLIDQHAAHERILFNRFLAGFQKSQKLLFPFVVESPSTADDEYLRSILPALREAGFEACDDGEGRWEFSAIPANFIGGEADLAEDLLEKRLRPDEVLYSLAAKTACRGAIKDGAILDAKTAQGLVSAVFELNEKTCPHGRPLFLQFSKATLYEWIRRTE